LFNFVKLLLTLYYKDALGNSVLIDKNNNFYFADRCKFIIKIKGGKGNSMKKHDPTIKSEITYSDFGGKLLVSWKVKDGINYLITKLEGSSLTMGTNEKRRLNLTANDLEILEKSLKETDEDLPDIVATLKGYAEKCFKEGQLIRVS
jgi:hypothetical protein